MTRSGQDAEVCEAIDRLPRVDTFAQPQIQSSLAPSERKTSVLQCRQQHFATLTINRLLVLDVSVVTGTLVAYQGKAPVFATLVSVARELPAATSDTTSMPAPSRAGPIIRTSSPSPSSASRASSANPAGT